MKYVSPKLERVEIEIEDILLASGEGEVEMENTSEGAADFSIGINSLFNKINFYKN